MTEIDELDMLRKPREAVVWRDRPVSRWKLRVITYSLLVAAVAIMFLIDSASPLYQNWNIFVPFAIIVLISNGGTSEAETLVTEDRILRQGGKRGFWGTRLEPSYSVSLSEVAEVSLADSGSQLLVEIRIAGSGRVDVLRANQPQVLAAVIAETTGIAKPVPVGRLEDVFDVCHTFADFPIWLSFLLIASAVADRIDQGLIGLVAIIAVAGMGSIFFSLLWIMLFAVIAVLFMPRYASAEEAAQWFRLKPRRRLLRWSGWKSQPYIWLARLVYGRDLKVRA